MLKKKRKVSHSSAHNNVSLQNSGQLLIKCPDDDDDLAHPSCPHGPTLLFYNSSPNENEEFKDGYFACSAHRGSGDCPFYLKLQDMGKSSTIDKKYEIDFRPFKEKRSKFMSMKSERSFCQKCQEPNIGTHCPPEHEVLTGITEQMLRNPTDFLRPLSDDKSEAQYFFDNRTLCFLEKCLSDLGITKVVCIGAPRLHFYLKQNSRKVKASLLLDLDKRFFYFCDDNEYAWFNMCNCHFFEGKAKEKLFERFLKLESSKDSVLIFTDPPFGCRTDPIAHTLKHITRTYQRVNNFHDMLPIFWVFPYYFEHYIQKFLPEMAMCDYAINYTNHLVFSDGPKGRKMGSPIRVFTNVQQRLIKLPEGEGYKLCNKCDRWTAKTNFHCDICRTCPSKNGDTYKHCTKCRMCVKPNYVHCDSCRRCTQKIHDCKEFRKHLRCWICRRVGHTEVECSDWMRKSKTKRVRSDFGGCLICFKFGHNEKNCAERKKFLEEEVFMGVVENVFNR